MGEIPIAIFNVDATKRPASINTQDKLLAHLGKKTPFRAPVSVFTEVPSKFFGERIAGAQPDSAHYLEYEFARYDRTVQVFPSEWNNDVPSGVSKRGKYVYTPLRVEGQDVLLYTVHLSRRSAAARKREFELLARSIEKRRPDYNEIVVCGDFNEQCDRVIDLLAGLDLHAAVQPGDTRTAASGAIDNLLASARVGPVQRWEKSLFSHTPLCVPVLIEK